MSWTRNSSSVIVYAFQKPTFDTATLMSASIGRVLVTRELLGTKNKITNQLIVLMSLGVSESETTHFRHTFLHLMVKVIMDYISEIVKS